VLFLFLSAICNCTLATEPATRPKTDIGRYYLTVRVVDYDKETPVSDATVKVVPSTCSTKDRALDASREEKILPSASQSTGPQGTVLFALSVDRKMPASLKMLISARFNPENVEDCKNIPLIEPVCSYYWNPIEQGDSEFMIVKPALRIVPSVTEQSVAPRGIVHVTTRILNLAPYPVDFSVLANEKMPTTQPPSEGQLGSEMSTEWSTEVSPPANGWAFGAQSISVYCCQIDEEEKWLQIVSTTVSFNVPSSQ
jgi:hypothetical protein